MIMVGGLSAPVILPLLVGSWAVGTGAGVAGVTVQGIDQAALEKRIACCRSILAQFPQMEAVLSS